MKTSVFLAPILILVSSCSLIKQKDIFGINTGSFVLYEQGKGIIKVINSKMAETQFSPCSTFKVPHAVFGLEKNYITGKDFTLKYDSKINPIIKFWPDNWAQDQNLESAIKNSVVWYFQNVARNIGPKQMKNYLEIVQYGNQDISGGIDTFWLGSSLKISPIEYVEFWSKLFNYKLPFKKENIDLVSDVLIEEQTPKYILRGKTGACSQSNKKYSAWWVGSLEQNNKQYYFATFILGDNYEKMIVDRKEITKSHLKKLGLL